MRAVIQRVLRGSVTLEPGTTKERKVAEIENGVVILLGVGQEDGPDDACYLARKVAQLRIFEDTEGKLNLSLLETKGAALVVSQFTLYGDCHQGRRPSFTQAAPAELGKSLYEVFIQQLKALKVPVATGQFQTHMQVEIINDGPVTMLLDSKKTF